MEPGRIVNIPANPKQQLAWAAWENDLIDDLVYGGAAGGGKTMLAGQVLTSTALKYPGTHQFLGRKELKTLMATSFVTLTQKVFPQYGLVRDRDWHFNGKANVIYFINPKTKTFNDYSSLINLLDLAPAPSDPLYDRFGSHEYTRGWIEEASEIPFKAYDVLKSRVGRWLNVELGIKSKLGLSLNPSQDWPYRVFYDVWKKAGKPIDPSTPLVSIEAPDADGKMEQRTFVFIPALYKDNPFAIGEYSKQLATITDPVLKQRLMDGDWEYSSAKDTLFSAAVIADLFKNPVIHSDDQYLIVDAARLGGDEIVLNHFRGWDSYLIERYTMLRTPETASKIITSADAHGIPRENILIDEDGVGGGVLDLVPGSLGFHGGASPFGTVGEKNTKENYSNLRSQCTYHLSTMAVGRKLRISNATTDTQEHIAQDLAQMKRHKADEDGKLQVTPKKDMKLALGRSPDCGDTLMMRSYYDLRARDPSIGSHGGAVSVYIPD